MAGRKSGSEKKVYKIGGEEVSDIREITLPLIQKHVMGLEGEDIQWLVDVLEKEVPAGKDEEGNDKVKKLPFFYVRNEFLRRYFPDLAPSKASGPKKPPVMEKTLAELKAALAAKEN